MSTMTKERAAQIAAGGGFNFDEIAVLARIALASLEAEAVCYLTWHQGFRAPDDCEEYVVVAKPGDKSCDGSPAFPVYAAPPAPVSEQNSRAITQHFDTLALETAREIMCDVNRRHEFLGGEVQLLSRIQCRIDDACRAAMLQGADGSSPVIPDGWVACSERMPEAGDDMIVFTDGIVMSGVSYSKKKGFYLQALEYDDDEHVENVTHWMPLPAAPKQE